MGRIPKQSPPSSISSPESLGRTQARGHPVDVRLTGRAQHQMSGTTSERPFNLHLFWAALRNLFSCASGRRTESEKRRSISVHRQLFSGHCSPNPACIDVPYSQVGEPLTTPIFRRPQVRQARAQISIPPQQPPLLPRSPPPPPPRPRPACSPSVEGVVENAHGLRRDLTATLRAMTRKADQEPQLLEDSESFPPPPPPISLSAWASEEFEWLPPPPPPPPPRTDASLAKAVMLRASVSEEPCSLKKAPPPLPPKTDAVRARAAMSRASKAQPKNMALDENATQEELAAALRKILTAGLYKRRLAIEDESEC